MPDTVKHPARFSKALIPIFKEIVDECRASHPTPKFKILDPFAGPGGVHDLYDPDRSIYTYGVEIEPEWAACHPRTQQGDATRLGWPHSTMNMVLTSCTYGNRFADHHKARDGSTRRSYTHDLRAMTGDPDRVLAGTNTGQFGFGTKQYQALHRQAWSEAWRVLLPGAKAGRPAWFVLNVSNFVAKGKVVDVCGWHVDVIVNDVGFNLIRALEVPTPRMRYGENGGARVDHEMIYVFTKP